MNEQEAKEFAQMVRDAIISPWANKLSEKPVENCTVVAIQMAHEQRA